MRWHLAVVLTFVAVALAGCGGDGNDSSSRSGGSSSAGSGLEPSGPDAGCTVGHPRRWSNTGRLAGFFSTCGTGDGSSMIVTNRSSTVLQVTATSESPEMTATAPPAKTLADQVVAETQRTWCLGTTGPCWMTRGGSITVTGAAPVAASLSVDPSSTAATTAAAMFGNWVAGKLESRADGLRGSVKSCAESVGKLATSQEYLEDTVRAAVDQVSSCNSLVKSVLDEVGEPSGAPAAATDDALHWAGKYSANLRRDLYVLAGIKVFTHVR